MRKSFFVVAVLAIICVSCHKSDEFTVEGSIHGAEDQCLYFEHLGLTKTETLDSVELSSTGNFSFAAVRPAYPELYRLRLGNKNIILAVDSNETIGVTASAANMAEAVFENSDKSAKIAALRLSLKQNSPVEHKELAKSVIMADPASIVAYYALFQQKAFEPVFHLDDPADRVFFQSVATSWKVWMPENPRTKALYQQVIDQMNSDRRAQSAALMQEYINQQETSSFLDIVMKDNTGTERALSELKGTVILLDFCSIDIEQYEAYQAGLNARYEKFHGKGFEIYQVYPDQNVTLWRNQVQDLPWITVRTDNGLLDNAYATYNVRNIPTSFIIDQRGEVIARLYGFKDLDQLLESVVK